MRFMVLTSAVCSDDEYHNIILFIKFSLSLLDMWAMGAIMAELFSLRPLFPGVR